MIFSRTELPNFVVRELEKLEKALSPFLKKASMYAFWSVPLILMSLVNLFILLIISPQQQNGMISIITYAAVGAVGMALSKEAKHKQKEIQRISSTYIIDRIKQSEVIPDLTKREYIALVQKRPIMAMQYLVKFLEEEQAKRNHLLH